MTNFRIITSLNGLLFWTDLLQPIVRYGHILNPIRTNVNIFFVRLQHLLLIFILLVVMIKLRGDNL